MRRPSFEGWVTRELSYLSGEGTINLRRLAYLAQASNPRLRERLVLYAIATGKEERLRSFLYREDIIEELTTLSQELRGKDFNNPAILSELQLPSRYMKALLSFKAAFQKIDTRNESKKLRWEKSVQLQREKGVPNTQICQYLNLDAGNVNTYLKHGAVEKLSLENATKIMKYLYSL